MAEENQRQFNMAFCFFQNCDGTSSNPCSTPNTPKLGMIVGTNRKIFKLWLDCYLLNYQDTDSKVTIAKSCIPVTGSNCRRVKYVCEGVPSCNWSITLTKNSKTGYWSVKALDDSHINCSHIQTNMSASVISLGIHSKAIVATGITASNMHENATELGFNGISHSKLYRARKKMISYGEKFSEGFYYAESYLINLYKHNPKSIIELQYYLDDDGQRRFGRLFIMLRSMIEAVIVGCKPVLSFDACFTKCELWGKYQILVAG
jgi:hypothetical protein